MSQLSYDEFVLELRDAIAKRTPWAFMRFGDGEGIILGYPQLTKEHEYLKRLDKWFGSKTMNGQERALFADNMKRAAVSANVLGVPGPRHKAEARAPGVVPRAFGASSLVPVAGVAAGVDGLASG